jgi:hypothetical protein
MVVGGLSGLDDIDSEGGVGGSLGYAGLSPDLVIGDYFLF